MRVRIQFLYPLPPSLLGPARTLPECPKASVPGYRNSVLIFCYSRSLWYQVLVLVPLPLRHSRTDNVLLGTIVSPAALKSLSGKSFPSGSGACTCACAFLF
ncbi:hypothetical protein EDB89DRAFT_153484 [Lactarius sanguifluus]|nr:hypothetical protein EDB89DRAFT_153484 [Lactarius sanguifluus]